MSDSDKKLRPLAEIQQEYNQLCFRAGNLQYSIKVQQDDLKLMNDALRTLNIEAAQSKAADEASKPPTLTLES